MRTRALNSLRESKAELKWTELDTPVGTLLLCRTEDGICRLEFGGLDERETAVAAWARQWWRDFALVREDGDPVLAEAVRQLSDYFRGNATAFKLPLDLRGTVFQRNVWKALLDVPYGSTASYRDIAASIGQPKAVRAVGGANNRNPVPIIVPCHRIIGSNGALVGYGGGLPVKEQLLRLEGAAAAPGR